MGRWVRRSPLLFALLVLMALVGACGHDGDTAQQSALWHCPMHPTYTSDRPGSCPICGMSLVPSEGAAVEDETTPASTVSGLATVVETEQGIELAGVRTAPALRERLGRTTRTVGLVVPDERRVRHVHTKIGGWVERLFVNTTGQLVRRGEPILALYSPELLASQEEYLRSREAAARFATSTVPEVRRGAEDLVVSARRRLELFDVPQSVLSTIERTGQAQRAVTLVAPASGFVSAKLVLEGMEVEPGTELFTLTDLSTVWVEAEFYENEARFLRLGQRAEVRLPYDASQLLSGEVTFIAPTLSAESRTIQARIELANADGVLKPGMFVDVSSELEVADGITIPEDAVIDTGLRRVVFVEIAANSFEPREVELGIRGSGRVVGSSGLREGESVATRANFLLDSESKLRSALAAAPGQPGHTGHAEKRP